MFVTLLNDKTFGKPEFVDELGRQYKRAGPEYPDMYDFRARPSNGIPIPLDGQYIMGARFIIIAVALESETDYDYEDLDTRTNKSAICGRVELEKTVYYLSSPIFTKKGLTEEFNTRRKRSFNIKDPIERRNFINKFIENQSFTRSDLDKWNKTAKIKQSEYNRKNKTPYEDEETMKMENKMQRPSRREEEKLFFDRDDIDLNDDSEADDIKPERRKPRKPPRKIQRREMEIIPQIAGDVFAPPDYLEDPPIEMEDPLPYHAMHAVHLDFDHYIH